MEASQRKPNYQGIGAPLRRVEDKRFLTGQGRFVADIALADALACALVRSPHAHAAIRKIDASAALAGPGVGGVRGAVAGRLRAWPWGAARPAAGVWKVRGCDTTRWRCYICEVK